MRRKAYVGYARIGMARTFAGSALSGYVVQSHRNRGAQHAGGTTGRFGG